jgi:hypothetical protein
MEKAHATKLKTIADNSIRNNPPKLLNVAEGSKYIGVSERTLRSWISERKIRVAPPRR